MYTQQLTSIASSMGRIAHALEILAQISNETAVSVEDTKDITPGVPVSPWESQNIPDGYDTVVGYFSKYRPSAFELLDDPIVGTLHDGFWLTHQCKARGLAVTRVEAPDAFKEAGISVVNAYPLDLLAERMAA